MKKVYYIMIFILLLSIDSFSQEAWQYIGKTRQEVITLMGFPNFKKTDNCLTYLGDNFKLYYYNNLSHKINKVVLQMWFSSRYEYQNNKNSAISLLLKTGFWKIESDSYTNGKVKAVFTMFQSGGPWYHLVSTYE